MNTDFIQIVNYASKAPSGHNAQPWKFHITANTITVIPNMEVALPVVDGSNRELFISLGCSVENLFIAAGRFGYIVHIVEVGIGEIKMELTKTKLVVEDSLFLQIEKRQTNRSVYNGNKIPDEVLKQLQSVPKENSVQLYFVAMGTSLAGTITDYVMKGNEFQMNDAAFKNELLLWIRFNKKQVESTRNGLSYLTFGSPSIPEWLIRPVVSLIMKSGVQNKSDRKRINSSSHFVVCTTQKNTIEEWIGLGRTLQRFLLKATEIGISYAFLNQPCEVPTLACALQKESFINKEYPTLVLRIGYATPMPYSLRKQIESLLV